MAYFSFNLLKSNCVCVRAIPFVSMDNERFESFDMRLVIKIQLTVNQMNVQQIERVHTWIETRREKKICSN